MAAKIKARWVSDIEVLGKPELVRGWEGDLSAEDFDRFHALGYVEDVNAPKAKPEPEPEPKAKPTKK